LNNVAKRHADADMNSFANLSFGSKLKGVGGHLGIDQNGVPSFVFMSRG